jgi:hypothetical protein
MRSILLCLALAALPAAAQFGATGPSPVVELYNTTLNHYFMTRDPAELADIDAGKAGPGWVRTGWYFTAFPYPVPASAATCFYGGCTALAPVSRFYGTRGLGPNSHFYTADAAEAAGLMPPGTGWTFENIAFTIPVPDANGQCPAPLTPVYRLYNQRFRFNDSNHRYVTSQEQRVRMQSLGWVDEGARFCAYSAGELAIKSFEIGTVDAPSKIRPSAQCEDESLNIGPCIAVNNLPTPNQRLVLPTTFATLEDASILREFYGRSGALNTTDAWVPNNNAALIDAAHDVFVQQSDRTIGIHVDTRSRGPASLSSVNPLYQLHNSAGPGLRDDRFFPFGAYESEVELQVSFTITVQLVNMRSAAGGAYGHPTLEFVDTKSGHHLYFTILTYGTVGQADYLAIDSSTGRVIVGTVFGPNASYGRSLGAAALSTPSGFDMRYSYSPVNHGDFDFRLARDEFRTVLARARTLDGALSAEPADYLLDNFHFNNEVAGDGEIGVALEGYRVRLLRRGAGFVPF